MRVRPARASRRPDLLRNLSATSSARIALRRRRGCLVHVERTGAEDADQPDDDQVETHDVAEHLRHDENEDAGDEGDDGGEGQVDVHEVVWGGRWVDRSEGRNLVGAST